MGTTTGPDQVTDVLGRLEVRPDSPSHQMLADHLVHQNQWLAGSEVESQARLELALDPLLMMLGPRPVLWLGVEESSSEDLTDDAEVLLLDLEQ